MGMLGIGEPPIIPEQAAAIATREDPEHDRRDHEHNQLRDEHPTIAP